MKKSVIILLYLITFLVYTQGYLERFTPIPAQLAIEICVLVLLLCSFRPKVGVLWMIIILVVGVLAALNTSGVASFIKYIRFFFYFYVIYTAFWNLHFTIAEFNRYVKFVVIMVLLQGVASIINLSFFGRAEYNVGAMSSLGGTTATAFPLFVFSILLVIYYFFSFTKTTWYLYILLMIASVFLMAYCSGKRAIFFYVPAFLVAISLVCPFFVKGNAFRRKLFWVSVAFVLFVPVYFFGVTQAGGIADRLEGNDSRIEILVKALEYAEDYEDAEIAGVTVGRSNTTEMVLGQAMASREGWFMGNGFGSIKDENEKGLAGVGYGFVGYSRDVFSGGIVFASLVALFMVFLILRHDVKPQDPFSIVMKIVVLAVFVVIHFTYSANFTVSLKLNMILAPMLCFLNSANYANLKEYYFVNYSPMLCRDVQIE